MARKSHFSIKAIPASELESLLAMMKRSKKQIELMVRAPTLSLKQVPNKFMNTLTSLSHLKGLDISEWDLPMAALTKLVRMTNLEQLTMGSSDINLSPLYNLTKLKLKSISIDKFPQIWQSLTNLQDLTLHSASVQDLEDIFTLTKLTRLHFAASWRTSSFLGHFINPVLMTALTNLKDLKIEGSTISRPTILLHASSTKLEALDIGVVTHGLDYDWIASNTQLTKFHVRLYTSRPDTLQPLTKLSNISSMSVIEASEVQLFTSLENLTELKFEQVLPPDFELIEKLTSLQVLDGRSYTSVAFPNTNALSNLTRISWLPLSYSESVFPTNVRELSAAFHVENLSNLTSLESLTLSKPSSLNMDTSEMVHLTKICLRSVEAQQALAILPKLSNLFTLRELSVTTPNNYQGLDADFLTTLTNLEALSMPTLNIPVHVFDKIVNLHTQLTQLHINCSESNGEILTRLTNLQVLEFYSSKPVKGLKKMLEENLPRLTVEVRV